MSIVAYSGLPGSGKSYGVVENVIIPALEAGRHIITNIPLKLGRLSDDYPEGKITQFQTSDPFDDKWCEYHEWTDDRGRQKKELVSNFWDVDKHPNGVIWVIDEAWRYWKSGTKANQIIEREMQFFTEHRHCVGEDGRTNEIVLVSQDMAQIASSVRSLIEETYRAVKLTAIGQKNKYRIDVFMGAATGQKPGKPMRQLYGKYKQEIYQYYQSHTRNKTDFAAGMEEKADDRANVLKSPMIKFGMPIALVMMLVGGWNAVSYFIPSEPETIEQPETQQQPVRAAQQSVRQAQAQGQRQLNGMSANAARQSQYEIEPAWLPVSDKWRIVGEVNGVFWIWGEHGTRQIHSRMCASFRKTGEPYCVIQGKLVTWYSYKEPERDGYDRESRKTYLDNFGGDSDA